MFELSPSLQSPWTAADVGQCGVSLRRGRLSAAGLPPGRRAGFKLTSPPFPPHSLHFLLGGRGRDSHSSTRPSPPPTSAGAPPVRRGEGARGSRALKAIVGRPGGPGGRATSPVRRGGQGRAQSACPRPAACREGKTGGRRRSEALYFTAAWARATAQAVWVERERLSRQRRHPYGAGSAGSDGPLVARSWAYLRARPRRRRRTPFRRASGPPATSPPAAPFARSGNHFGRLTSRAARKRNRIDSSRQGSDLPPPTRAERAPPVAPPPPRPGGWLW